MGQVTARMGEGQYTWPAASRNQLVLRRRQQSNS